MQSLITFCKQNQKTPLFYLNLPVNTTQVSQPHCVAQPRAQSQPLTVTAQAGLDEPAFCYWVCLLHFVAMSIELSVPPSTMANLAPRHTILCVSFSGKRVRMVAQKKAGAGRGGGGRGAARCDCRRAGRVNANVPHSWEPVSTHPSILSGVCCCLGNQREQQQSHFIFPEGLWKVPCCATFTLPVF